MAQPIVKVCFAAMADSMRQRITVAAGCSFEVHLHEMSGAGYTWCYFDGERDFVQVDGVVVKESEEVGGGSVRIFKLSTRRSGDISLEWMENRFGTSTGAKAVVDLTIT